MHLCGAREPQLMDVTSYEQLHGVCISSECVPRSVCPECVQGSALESSRPG